jgi:hypothetical protein
MSKQKGPSPFKVWCEEKNYTGHRNKKMIYTFTMIGIMIGFALGILI